VGLWQKLGGKPTLWTVAREAIRPRLRGSGIGRTEGEFRALLTESGFVLRRIVPTTSVYALSEATPA
jgi:hypothetical protein